MAAEEPLDWDDLRYFLGAVRAGTLAGASRAMKVEHTTIGRRLSSLERSLGGALMLRGPEGLKLTPLGENLVPMVEKVEQAIIATRDLVASQTARVRLAVPSGFAKIFTAGLAKLRREHPRLSLELVSGARPVDLKRGEADLALRIGPVGDKDLIVRKLGESSWSLYASEAYLERRRGPIDPSDLAGHEVIGYDRSLAATPAAQWMETRATNATVVLRSREMTDMVSAAVDGVGLAVLPCILGDAEPSLKRLTRKAVATRNISLVFRREARLSANVRTVVRFVMDILREHAARA